MYLTLKVTEEEREQAIEMAKQQRGAGLGIGGTSKFQTKDPILDHSIGLIGEIKWEQLLYEGDNYMYRWHNVLNGRGDPYDFAIYRKETVNGRMEITTYATLDIKTGYLKQNDSIDWALRNFYYFINAEQMGKRVNYFIYNLLSFDKTELYIIGAIKYDLVIRKEEYAPKMEGTMISKAYRVAIRDLQSMKDFFKELGMNIDTKKFTGGQGDLTDFGW